jgi:hypothetical protein
MHTETAAPPARQEQQAYHDQKIAMPQKRYAHLPLVADEMRKTPAPSSPQQPDIPAMPPRRKASSGKKGVLGLLNRK